MSAIENRIVSMKFINSDFRKGAEEAIADLDNLDSKLSSVGQTGEIEGSLENVNGKFVAMATIGVAALSHLTGYALDAGKRMGLALVEPIVEGGKRRAANIEQAKFQFKGLGLDVEQSMAIANAAVEGTAYGLDSAAKAAGQLAASNVAMGADMEQALRGIAGVAAMTSSSYDDIANVFIKVAGQGRVMGDDLLSLSSRGMNAASILSKYFGKTEADVRKMVTDGEIGFADFAAAMDNAFGEHAKAANETYSGSMSNMRAALSRVGELFVSKKMAASIPLFASITHAINATKAALVPFADVYGALLENRNNTFLIPFFEHLASAIEKATPAITNVVQGFMNIRAAVFSYISPIASFIGSIFSFDDSGIVNFVTKITESFKNLTEKLILTEERTEAIKEKLSAVGEVIGKAAAKVGEFAKSVYEAAQALANRLYPYIKSAIVQVQEFANSVYESGRALVAELTPYVEAATQSFQTFKDAMGDILAKIVDEVKKFVASVKDEMSRLSFSKAMAKVVPDKNPIKETLASFSDEVDVFSKSAVPSIETKIENVGSASTSAFHKLKTMLTPAFEGIKEVFHDFSFEKLLTGINFAMITTSIYKLVQGISALMRESAGAKKNFQNFMKSMSKIPDTIKSLGKSLENFGNSTEGLAPKLIAIAIGIGVLAAATYFLAQVPMDRLGPALGAVSLMLLELSGAIYGLTKIDKEGSLKTVTKSMIMMSVALLLMAAAIAKLSSVPSQQLGQGLAAASAGLMLMAMTLTVLSKQKGSVQESALAMILMSVALGLLTNVIVALGLVPMDVLIQGISMLAGVLALLMAAVLAIQGTNVLATAQGMLLMAVAINVMVGAIVALGLIDMDILGQGLFVIAAALIMLATVAELAQGELAGAQAILILAGATVLMAGALLLLAAVPFMALVNSLTILSVGMFMLVGAGYAAEGATIGLAGVSSVLLAFGASALMVAASVVIFAIGLAMLGPALVSASGGLMVLGYTAQAMVGALLPLAGLTLVLIAFSVAVAALGVALLLAGAGASLLGLGFMALGVGFTMTAASAKPAGKALKEFLDNFGLLDMAKLAALGLALIPLGAGMLALGLGSALAAVGLVATSVALAVLSPMIAIFKASSKGLDKTGQDYQNLATAMEPLAAISMIVATGFGMTATNVGRMNNAMRGSSEASTAASASMKLLAATMQQVPQVISAASTSVTASFSSLAVAVASGMTILVASVTSNAGRFAESLVVLPKAVIASGAVLAGAFGMLNAIVVSAMLLLTATYKNSSRLFANEIKQTSKAAQTAFVAVGTAFLKIAPANAAKARAASLTIVAAVVSSLAGSRGTMYNGGYNAGLAMTNGMAYGLSAGSSRVSSMARNVAINALNSAKRSLGIASPSKEFAKLGMYSMMGFSRGIERNQSRVYESVDNVANSTLDSMQNSFKGLNGLLDSLESESINIDVNLQTDGIDSFNRELSNLMSKASVIPAIGVLPQYKVEKPKQDKGTQSKPEKPAKEEKPQNITKVFNYTQNNNSPKALSNVDIYRNTKSQLASMRRALNI